MWQESTVGVLYTTKKRFAARTCPVGLQVARVMDIAVKFVGNRNLGQFRDMKLEVVIAVNNNAKKQTTIYEK